MLDRDTVIALHEAGHAVISRVLQLPSGAATIDGAPRAYLQDDHGLASLLTAMAGSAAERELVGVAGGTDGDRPKVEWLLERSASIAILAGWSPGSWLSCTATASPPSPRRCWSTAR
jgi:hypothetical protein